MKNNLGNSFNNKNEEEKIESDEDDKATDQDGEFSYQNFCKLKKKIFQFIENNSAAKEKKKILALIKANKYKKV